MRDWTPADDALLRSLAASGVSPNRMAVQLKRPVNSVRRRAHVLEVPLPKPLRIADLLSVAKVPM